MVDFIDNTQDDIEREQARTLKVIRQKASEIPEGEAGECELCGEPSLRLVNNACAKCRDKYKLP